MKRIALILIVLILSPSLFAADREYQDSVSVSFIAGIMANFGFSTQPVSPTVKPTTTIPDDTIKFKYRPESQDYATDVYYIYYQVFTPASLPLSLYANATPLYSENGNELLWEDLNDRLTCDMTTENMIGKSLSVASDHPYNSIPFQLVIDSKEIAQAQDFFGNEYKGSITLTIETQ